MQEATPILGWENRRERLWLLKFRSLKSCKLDLSMGGNLSASPGITVHGRRAPVWGAWGPQVWVQGILRPPTSEEGHLLTGGTSLTPWILDKLLTLEQQPWPGKGLGDSGRKGDQAVWMVAIRTCSGFRMTVFAPSSATCYLCESFLNFGQVT